MRILISLTIAVCLWGQDDPAANRERIRSSLAKLRDRDAFKKDLLFERRMDRKELAPDGQVKSQKIIVTRRDPWDELVVTRVILRDGKPLTDEENRTQDEKLRKGIEDLRKNPPKAKDDQEPWIDELPDAIEFQKVGTELRNGRNTDIYEFGPRPGYKAKQMRARAFEKIRGKVWVDRQDGEMAKMDVVVFDTINVGFGMLGRIEKGTHFEMERKKWPVGVWFEEWQRIRFDIHVMLVKSMHQEIETRWSSLSFKPALPPARIESSVQSR